MRGSGNPRSAILIIAFASSPTQCQGSTEEGSGRFAVCVGWFTILLGEGTSDLSISQGLGSILPHGSKRNEFEVPRAKTVQSCVYTKLIRRSTEVKIHIAWLRQ